MSAVAPKINGPRHASAEEVIQWITEVTGVELVERQRGLMETRLRKRLIDLRLVGFDEYLEYLSLHYEQETQVLISLFTTHHTYFFREFMHFQYLESEAILHAAQSARARGDKVIRIWSAACSMGQEVYSLALLFDYCLPKIAPDCTYEIFGSDIDVKSVTHAQNGVYRFNEIKEIPFRFLGKNFVRGTGEIAEFVKVRKEIKYHCEFDTINLFKSEGTLKGRKFDFIFCRNVYIYFTQTQIRSTTKTLLEYLQPEGQLFLGVSESLHGLDLPITNRGNSIYSRPQNAPAKNKLRSAARPSQPKKLRVLCVDDSPSILMLLKQVLKPELGFEVVGTAASGIEAREKLKTLTIDLMTLDIHMPEQTGLEYLTQNFKPNHPPVIMISRVAAQDTGLALECLKRGASDYVEKPALANILQRGDEIRSKLSSAFLARKESLSPPLDLVKSFGTTFSIKDPAGKQRVVITGLSDWKRVKAFLAEQKGSQPPLFIFIEGSESILGAFVDDRKNTLGRPMKYITKMPTAAKIDEIYVGDFQKLFLALRIQSESRKTSVTIFGASSKQSYEQMQIWKAAQILVEDLSGIEAINSSKMKLSHSEVVPVTSFSYLATQFFSGVK